MALIRQFFYYILIYRSNVSFFNVLPSFLDIFNKRTGHSNLKLSALLRFYRFTRYRGRLLILYFYLSSNGFSCSRVFLSSSINGQTLDFATFSLVLHFYRFIRYRGFHLDPLVVLKLLIFRLPSV